jgi:hypothetical protein
MQFMHWWVEQHGIRKHKTHVGGEIVGRVILEPLQSCLNGAKIEWNFHLFLVIVKRNATGMAISVHWLVEIASI